MNASVRNHWAKLKQVLHLHKLSPGVRRAIVGVIGSLVLLLGLAMVFLPGPALVVVPLGLAILASEFAWAHRLLHNTRDWFKRAGGKMRRRWSSQGGKLKSKTEIGRQDTG